MRMNVKQFPVSLNMNSKEVVEEFTNPVLD